MKSFDIVLPPKDEMAMERLFDKDPLFYEGVFYLAERYAETAFVHENDIKVFVTSFPKLLTNGFYKIDADWADEEIKFSLQVWSPSNRSYMHPTDCPLLDLEIIQVMVEYFISTN